MDTLCIPVSLEKPLRRKAIAQMNFLFSGVDNVLVIDSSLQPVAENSVSRLQLRLQLACSPWMTRCWTFQEARLARAWHVYLRTTLYEPRHDYHREMNIYFRIHTRKTIWTDQNELEREAISFYRKIWPLIDQDPNYKPPIFVEGKSGEINELIRIWNQLNERSTTRQGDRLIILAVLLDLNAGEIMALDVEEQIRAILRTQDELPLCLLFEPQTVPATWRPKCRWIPTYPKGQLFKAYDCMTRSRTSNHYQFTLSGIKALGFLLDSKDSNRLQFSIKQALPSAFEACISIIPREVFPSSPTRGSTCIILSKKKKLTSDYNTPLVGARFFLETTSSDARTLTLVYHCPVVYTLIKPIESSSTPAGYPKLQASVLTEETQIRLDCGM